MDTMTAVSERVSVTWRSLKPILKPVPLVPNVLGVNVSDPTRDSLCASPVLSARL